MKTPRIDVAKIRKEQIVEAAVAVITEQGLHNLSLSEIENKAGMKRGQLTYYFRHKEDILLAVFDRVIQILELEQVEYEREAVFKLVERCFPDFRKTLNELVRYQFQQGLRTQPMKPEAQFALDGG